MYRYNTLIAQNNARYRKWNGKDGRRTDGKPGESIDVSSMFEICTSLEEVNLSYFVGRGGNGYGGAGANVPAAI